MSTLEPIKSNLRLRVLEGGSHSELHSLERALISIGRSTPDTPASANYLTFPEPTVSRLHAVLTWEAGAHAYLLHHRSQTNPTILNNAIIQGPVLLKAGDRITLGRLVLLVEIEAELEAKAEPSAKPESGDTEPAIAAEPPLPLQLSLNAKAEEEDRIFSAPLREATIVLSFTGGQAGTASPIQPAPGWQEIRLPGPSDSRLRFEVDASTESFQVTADLDRQAPTMRLSQSLAGAELQVPLKVGLGLPLSTKDSLLHQGFQIWVGDPDNPPPSVSHTAPDERSRARVSLEFLNGPWAGAVITVSRDSSNLRLAPGEESFPYPLPLEGCPQAEITTKQGRSQLRALEVPDEQFLEVDGKLVLASESLPLIGGSHLLLGTTEFLWHDGSEAVYSTYRLVDNESGTAYPFRKASVRLGTAAHCEILLTSRELPPSIGSITIDGASATYLHTDLSSTVRIDGEELSSGLTATLRPGSVLELKPGLALRLEQTPPT